MSYFNNNPQHFSMILPGDCHRLFRDVRAETNGKGKKKKIATLKAFQWLRGLRKALSMVLIEKGLSSMETKQDRLYVILLRLFTEY